MAETKSYPFNPTLYHHKFQCCVYEIHYNFKLNLGVLIMSEDSCCDMKGCIDFFSKINPNIIQIQTYAGTEPDTGYKLIKDIWKAIPR